MWSVVSTREQEKSAEGGREVKEERADWLWKRISASWVCLGPSRDTLGKPGGRCSGATVLSKQGGIPFSTKMNWWEPKT